MLRIDHALRCDRVLKALTGLSILEFIDLRDRFATVLAHRHRPDPGTARQRQPGGGRKPELTTAEDKLFFILFYVKCYPTFDVAGVLFEVHRSQPHRWVHTLLPLLEQTLGEAVVLPARKIDDVAAFFERFPQVKNLFIDGQERPTQRPKQPEAQQAHYSGKKNGTRVRISWSVMNTDPLYFSRPRWRGTNMIIRCSKRATFRTTSHRRFAVGSI